MLGTLLVSILTRPEGRVQRSWRRSSGIYPKVSILTRPEGRVQRAGLSHVALSRRVSILTRPEGRVQLGRQARLQHVVNGFNPHPSRRTGATGSAQYGVANGLSFNPHPSRRTGATHRFHRIRTPERCFNPHPSRRTGATSNGSLSVNNAERFQSSPVPKDGCNLLAVQKVVAILVSILTRPEGRVQRWPSRVMGAGLGFQSSPVPKDGCN